MLFLAGAVFGACFFSTLVPRNTIVVKNVTDTVTITEKIKVDSIVHDSISHTEYKWKVQTHYITNDSLVYDTILVEVPIEYHHASKPDTFDIYYHGAYSALDSVFVYNRTHYITKTNFIEPAKNLLQVNVSNFSTSVLYSRRFNSFYLGGGVGLNYQKQPEVSLQVGYSF